MNFSYILAYRIFGDELNDAYKQKLDENQKDADDTTAKERKKNKRIRNLTLKQKQTKIVIIVKVILKVAMRGKKNQQILKNFQLMIL